MRSGTTAIFLKLCTLMLFSAMASDTVNNEDQSAKVLYEQACAACHSRDLGGAFGFNLKDGEWIHGSEPNQIIENVKKGFLSAGMPGFAAMYSDEQISSIVTYILSKREGFTGLTYKLYEMQDADDREVDANKLVKSGNLKANFPDFQLPEVQHYIIEFEGDFYTPKNENSRVWIEWGRHTDITFIVDGEIVKRDNQFGEWVPTWPLKRGKQHLKIIFRSGHAKPHRRNVSLIVTNDDMSIKLFPASVKARSIMEGKKIELIVTDKPLVQRIKTIKLPTYSIAVGFPQKINFAFNTRQCAVVGLWQGDMLNVGPNIGGRGEDASLPLGDWIFHSPQTIKHNSANSAKCHYKGYQLIANNPVFNYQIGDVEFSLSAIANNNGIHFNYVIKTSSETQLSYTLPSATNLKWQSNQGQIIENQITITPDAEGKFSLSAQLN
jgi:cytochrome c5